MTSTTVLQSDSLRFSQGFDFAPVLVARVVLSDLAERRGVGQVMGGFRVRLRRASGVVAQNLS